jgi:DNA (cytosine-5)-methyltransferase 1
MMEYTFGSLFSGIGGLDLGFERAGWKCLWQSEIKPDAVRVLEAHWPDLNRGDVRLLNSDTLARPTLILGGFPCQNLSHANVVTRNGLAGQHSGLWAEFLRVIGGCLPRWVVIENVDTWRTWVPSVRAGLARFGYASLPVELSAGSFGAPHRRPRVFVVAHANGDSEPLLSIHAKVGKLRPISGPSSRDWGNSSPRNLPLDDGFPRRVAQNDLYGNAVVPAVAEWLGRTIAESA